MDSPSSLSEYSTFGGTSAYTVLVTRPFFSIERMNQLDEERAVEYEMPEGTIDQMAEKFVVMDNFEIMSMYRRE